MEFLRSHQTMILTVIVFLVLYYVGLYIYNRYNKKSSYIKNINDDVSNKENINIFDQTENVASFNDDNNISSPGKDIDNDNWRGALKKIQADSEEVSHNNSLRDLLGNDDVKFLDED